MVAQANLQKPKAVVEVDFSTIPQSMKDKCRWCVWRYDLNEKTGKYAKVPYQCFNKRASSNDEKTWSTFEMVKEHYLKCKDSASLDGIGYFLDEHDAGIDLDDCVVDGEPNQEARTIIQEIDSYSEISPSATGVRIFLLGDIDLKGNRKKNGKEMYGFGSPRFLTVTGYKIWGDEVEENQEGIDWFQNKHLGYPEAKTHANNNQVINPVDQDLRTKLAKFYLDGTPGAKQGAGVKGADSYVMAIAGTLSREFDIKGDTAVELLLQWGQRDDQVDSEGQPWKWDRKSIERKVDAVDDDSRPSDGTYKKILERYQENELLNNFGQFKTSQSRKITVDDDPNNDDFHNGDDGGKKSTYVRPNNHNPSNTYDFIGIKNIRKISEENPVTWFVDGWLMKGALAMLAAHSFAGKSQFLSDLAPAIANGLPIFGLDIRQTPVLMIDVENHESVIDARINKMKLDDDNQYMYWISKASLRGKLPLDTDSMREIITQFYAATGFTECVVFCDTLRSLFQIDETDSKQINDLFYPLQQLAQEMGVCLVLLNHRPKSNASYSGHNSMMAALDMFMMYEREGKRDSILKMEGTRLTPPDDVYLRFDPATSTLAVRDAVSSAGKLEQTIKETVFNNPGLSQKSLIGMILTTWVESNNDKPGRDKIRDGIIAAADKGVIVQTNAGNGYTYHPLS